MGDLKKAKYRIFISYRRADNQDFVERIRDWLAQRYGHENVFMDVQDINSGARYLQTISDTIKKCDALLAIIGPTWIDKITEDPYNEEDWIRMELRLAFEAERLVMPVYIKGTQRPPEKLVPPSIRGIFKTHEAHLDSGKDFTLKIRDIFRSLDKELAVQISRKREIDKLEESSPAAGLALGYYVNFVNPVVNQLVSDGLQVDREGPVAGQVNATRHVRRLWVVIPPRVAMLKGQSFATFKRGLSRATIETQERQFDVVSWESDPGSQLIDFPATLTVLEHLTRRQMRQDEIHPDSDKASEIETQELDRFEKALNWWINDPSNVPDFRNRVRVVRFTPENSELKWLSEIWKL